MKKTNGNITKEIISYFKKLSPLKQIEALDFVKWLWGGPGADRGFSQEELEKIESLRGKKGGVKFKSWKEAKSYLENLAQ
jgi:hypothetical protein